MAAHRKLAFGVKGGQADGDIHWIDGAQDIASQRTPTHDLLKPSRAILFAIPASLFLWSLALGIVGYATLG